MSLATYATANGVKAGLAGRAEEFVQWLLPNVAASKGANG